MAIHLDYLCDHPALIAEFAELNFNEWGHYKPGNTLEAQTEHMRASCGRGSVPTVVVAIEDSQLLGGALLLAHDLDSRPQLTPWLAGVYVKPEHRGRGIPSQLVTRIVEEAAQVGVPELYLCTPNAQALYAKLGWEEIEEVDDNGLVTVMKRSTAP
ncbi:GNAT family N-acetyltransferase [Pseudomonas sp. 10S4]|uniref:GNAT family N-acetyltransferase n=1 Tax=Pseudomonas sp. 10S4 TaxID=3048583 RepID=UPI002AC94309|nr:MULTISPECIES: GNAT family N-acetyltransferase [unclassified Pseudomonas]MEB0227947.1 GNAT family N-acetyltransferase [Pseudomonas sp. 5S1]MEB0294331.1 GNAT family N-acetyltransferase [Pseudomonas sp. 10S4]WPX18212.1 GNAT family N-acetyltransferase [Pseudomonas sp. 10S4]